MTFGKQARVEELRREIAGILEENKTFKGAFRKNWVDEAENTRRAVRLREIQAELLEMMGKRCSDLR